MKASADKDSIVQLMLSAGQYKVLEDGTLISFKQNIRGGRILTPVPGGGGYLRYQLFSPEKKPITFYAHRIVALALIPNPCNLPEVNHIDGNKENNHPSNLEWVSKSGNQTHAIKMGLKTSAKGSQLSSLSESDIERIKSLYATGNYTQKEIGAVYGLKQNTISTIVNGVNWKHLKVAA